LKHQNIEHKIQDIDKNDPDELLENTERTYIYILSSYENPEEQPGILYLKYLEDLQNDFRIQKDILKNKKFCIFGIGDSLNYKDFNHFSKKMEEKLLFLSAQK
jgi:hypothetical protein